MDIHPDEIQTAIIIPKASYENTYGHYIKYSMRNAMDIATLGCSVNVRLSPDKKTIERATTSIHGIPGAPARPSASISPWRPPSAA